MSTVLADAPTVKPIVRAVLSVSILIGTLRRALATLAKVAPPAWLDSPHATTYLSHDDGSTYIGVRTAKVNVAVSIRAQDSSAGFHSFPWGVFSKLVKAIDDRDTIEITEDITPLCHGLKLESLQRNGLTFRAQVASKATGAIKPPQMVWGDTYNVRPEQMLRALASAQTTMGTNCGKWKLDGIVIRGDSAKLAILASDRSQFSRSNLDCSGIGPIGEAYLPSEHIKALRSVVDACDPDCSVAIRIEAGSKEVTLAGITSVVRFPLLRVRSGDVLLEIECEEPAFPNLESRSLGGSAESQAQLSDPAALVKLATQAHKMTDPDSDGNRPVTLRCDASGFAFVTSSGESWIPQTTTKGPGFSRRVDLNRLLPYLKTLAKRRVVYMDAPPVASDPFRFFADEDDSSYYLVPMKPDASAKVEPTPEPEPIATTPDPTTRTVWDVVQIVDPGTVTSTRPGTWLVESHDDRSKAERVACLCNEHAGVLGIRYAVLEATEDAPDRTPYLADVLREEHIPEGWRTVNVRASHHVGAAGIPYDRCDEGWKHRTTHLVLSHDVMTDNFRRGLVIGPDPTPTAPIVPTPDGPQVKPKRARKPRVAKAEAIPTPEPIPTTFVKVADLRVGDVLLVDGKAEPIASIGTDWTRSPVLRIASGRELRVSHHGQVPVVIPTPDPIAEPIAQDPAPTAPDFCGAEAETIAPPVSAFLEYSDTAETYVDTPSCVFLEDMVQMQMPRGLVAPEASSTQQPVQGACHVVRESYHVGPISSSDRVPALPSGERRVDLESDTKRRHNPSDRRSVASDGRPRQQVRLSRRDPLLSPREQGLHPEGLASGLGGIRRPQAPGDGGRALPGPIADEQQHIKSPMGNPEREHGGHDQAGANDPGVNVGPVEIDGRRCLDNQGDASAGSHDILPGEAIPCLPVDDRQGDPSPILEARSLNDASGPPPIFSGPSNRLRQFTDWYIVPLIRPAVLATLDGEPGEASAVWSDRLGDDDRATFGEWLDMIGSPIAGTPQERWDAFLRACVTGSPVTFPGRPRPDAGPDLASLVIIFHGPSGPAHSADTAVTPSRTFLDAPKMDTKKGQATTTNTSHSPIAEAQRKARYGHKDWLAWRNGIRCQWKTAPKSNDTALLAAKAVFEGGTAFMIEANHGTLFKMNRNIAHIATRTIEAGHQWG